MEKEIEYKRLLSREEWQVLKNFCEQKTPELNAILGVAPVKTSAETVIQSNHYFDFAKILAGNKTVCRIRCFADEKKPILFFKTKDLRELKTATFDTTWEFSQSLTREEVAAVLSCGCLDLNRSPTYAAVAAKMTDWLSTSKQGWSLPKQLQLLGSLTTKRHILRFADLEVCFDYNRYFDREDYEVEMEGSTRQIEAALTFLCTEFSTLCRFESLTPSKFQRFRSAYSETSQAN